MIKTLGFAFGIRNICSRVLYNIENIDYRYLIFPKNINKFIEKIKTCKPQYILGLGLYRGPERNYMHIETRCSNMCKDICCRSSNINYRDMCLINKGNIKYRYIKGSEYIELWLNNWIKPNKYLKCTSTIGNYYCNMVSFLIMDLIYTNKLDTKFSFIHIPVKMKKEVIYSVFENYQLPIANV